MEIYPVYPSPSVTGFSNSNSHFRKLGAPVSVLPYRALSLILLLTNQILFRVCDPQRHKTLGVFAVLNSYYTFLFITQQECCCMNQTTPDCQQRARPQHGFGSLPEDLLVSKVKQVVPRPPPHHAGSHQVMRKDDSSPVGLEAPGMSPVLNLPTLTHIGSSATVPLQCHRDTHFPPWHLFILEAGSEGGITEPRERAQAPLHRGAQRVDSRGTSGQPHISGAARRNKRHKCHISLFSHWWFLLLPWAPPYDSAQSSFQP